MLILPFLHFFGFIACLTLALYVLYKDKSSLINWTCSLLMLCFSIWNFGDIIVHNPNTTVKRETVELMRNISSIGWICFSSIILCFSFIFSKKDKWLKKKWFLFLVTLLPLLFIYRQWTSSLSMEPLKQSYGWSFAWKDSWWTYFFYFYYLSATVFSIFQIHNFGRNTEIAFEKKQAKIITFSILISLAIGTVFDVIIIELGEYSIPNIGNLLVFILALGILYAIVKYRFLTITATIAAENIISAMDELLILINTEGNILSVNKATQNALKYEPTELVGKSVMVLFTNEDFKKRLLNNIDNEEIISNQDGCIYAKNGEVVPIIYSCSPVKNNIGTVLGTVFIARDITERRKAEESLNESINIYRTLIEKMPDGVYKTSHAGRVIDINPALVNILGFSRKEELLGINIGEELYFDPSDREKMTNEGLNNELISYRLRKKDGSEVWVEDHGWYTFDNSGDIVYHEGIIRDITSRKKTEKELIIAKVRAEESDRLKSAFLANMSHEIRTPMNGILGFAELLKNPDLSGEDQQNYIQIIENSGARMLNIINDIVDISKIEAGLMQVNLKETNINEQIEYIYSFFKTEVEAKGLQFCLRNTLPPNESIIKTDREKVYAILTNLVKNAIKYTEKGSIELGYKIVDAIQTSTISVSAKMLVFYVKDTGIGIQQSLQEKVFERFIQADSSDKKAYQGAGLGLSITKAYVEMLGGKIWLESEPDIGSTFYFSLPYHNVSEEKILVQKDETAEKELDKVDKLKILIAEDDEISKLFIATIVRELGNEVLEVRTGSEAIEIFLKNPDIDLILMDIQMPELSGYEATRRIRQFNKDVIIIAQTAYGLAGDREKAIESGCDDYISKPIKKAELHALMQKYFRNQQKAARKLNDIN